LIPELEGKKECEKVGRLVGIKDWGLKDKEQNGFKRGI
jgi:hypothetical protein